MRLHLAGAPPKAQRCRYVPAVLTCAMQPVIDTLDYAASFLDTLCSKTHANCCEAFPGAFSTISHEVFTKGGCLHYRWQMPSFSNLRLSSQESKLGLQAALARGLGTVICHRQLNDTMRFPSIRSL